MRWRLWKKTGCRMTWPEFRKWLIEHTSGTGWKN